MLTTPSFREGFLSAYLPAMSYAELYYLFHVERRKNSIKVLHMITYQPLIQAPEVQTEM